MTNPIEKLLREYLKENETELQNFDEVAERIQYHVKEYVIPSYVSDYGDKVIVEESEIKTNK